MDFYCFYSSVSLGEISASEASWSNFRKAPWHSPCPRDMQGEYGMWPPWEEHSGEQERGLHECKVHQGFMSLFLTLEWVIAGVSQLVPRPGCLAEEWVCKCTLHSLFNA